MPVEPKKKPQLPDFMARLKKIYGNRVLKPSNSELIACKAIGSSRVDVMLQCIT